MAKNETLTKSFDENFVQVCLLDGKGGVQMVGLDQQQTIREHPGTIWIHTHYANHSVIDHLKIAFDLDEFIIEALQAENTRPRTLPHEEGLLMVLRGVNLNAGQDPEDMVSIRLWASEKLILSTAKFSLLSVDDVLEQFARKRGAIDTASLLVELIDRLVWRMNSIVDEMEDHVAELEERMVEEGTRNLRFELSTLRRQSISLRRHLAPEREALAKLISERTVWLDNDSRIYLREINDRLIRHIEDIDTVRERAAITHEELNSRHSEQLNAKMYLLSIVAAIFLPLGFLTGLLGINVGGIPGADNPRAFLVFCGLLIGAVAIQITVFRWKKWL